MSSWEFGSGWDASYAPTDCDPSAGPSSGNCTSIYVSTSESVCLRSVASTCTAAASFYDNSESLDGFQWGMVVSLVGDVVISGGLALQKVAHNRIEKIKKEKLGVSLSRQVSSTKLNEVEGPKFTSMPIWWAGMLCTIVGEVGNFAAYGDANTPASVVTAVGCVGVISTSIISTTFLGERFRRRDALGIVFVLVGVILVVVFAPQQQKTLTAGLLNDYLSSAGTIVYLVLLFGSIAALYILIPRFGHLHVLWNLSMASLIGSITVMSSKAVATFVIQTIEGFVVGPIVDQVDLGYGNNSAGCWEDGHTWGQIVAQPVAYGCITVSPAYTAVNNSAGDVIVEGLSQHDNPFLYIAILLMVVTAVAQVKYLNQGMALFDISEVVPAHYVTFTLFSILGTSIVYQEFAITYEGVCRVDIFLHFFLDGCLFTFVGVWLITSNRDGAPGGADAALEGTEMLELEHKPAAADAVHVELGRDTRAKPPPPAAGLGEDSTAGPPLKSSFRDVASVSPLKNLGSSGIGRQATSSGGSAPSPRRQSMAEAWGLPDGGLDARSRRDSRAASVSTFVSMLGGGHAAAFLFDPLDKKNYGAELDAARQESMQMAERRYSRSVSIARSFTHAPGGDAHGPARSVSALDADGAPIRVPHCAASFPSPNLNLSGKGTAVSAEDAPGGSGVSSSMRGSIASSSSGKHMSSETAVKIDDGPSL